MTYHTGPASMKLAANLSLLYPEMALEERMACAARDGFAYAEILFPYEMAPANLARALAAHELELVLINTPPGPNGEKGLAALPGRQAEFRAALRQALDVCDATGCRSIHVLAGQPPNAQAPESRDTLLENLKAAALQANEKGVTLTLEALNRHDMPAYFYHRPSQAIDILETLRLPGLRLQFDFYHTQREGLSIGQELEQAMPWVHHVQLAGPNGRHEPDLLDPDVRQGLLMLRDHAYAGWIGAEYTPAGDATAGLTWRDEYSALLGSPS